MTFISEEVGDRALASLNAQLYGERLRGQTDQTRVSELAARLENARLQFEAFQTSLYAAHPELKLQQGEIQPITIQEAATLITNAKSALLEYLVTEEKTYLFVLTRPKSANWRSPDLEVFTLSIKQKDLAGLVERFRAGLAQRDYTTETLGLQLYNLLLKPAARYLSGKTSLVIVPDQVLWELPFQALQSERGRHLIEDSAISYAPSLTALLQMVNTKKRHTRAGHLIAFFPQSQPLLMTERIFELLLEAMTLRIPVSQVIIASIVCRYRNIAFEIGRRRAISEIRTPIRLASVQRFQQSQNHFAADIISIPRAGAVVERSEVRLHGGLNDPSDHRHRMLADQLF